MARTNTSRTAFAREHKKRTGFSLKSEQFVFESTGLATDEEKKKILAECFAHDEKYNNK